jgi:hypothetical protein
MKLVSSIVLVDHDGYSQTQEFELVSRDIENAIAAVVNPPGNDRFTINADPIESETASGKIKQIWHMNGVLPIKQGFTSYLFERGWVLEFRNTSKNGEATPGAFDCHYTFPDSDTLPFAVEWETGNVSSSHRAINRLAVGIRNGNISGGILVLPTGAMKKIITDRIGNSPELGPYLGLWSDSFDRLAPTPYYLGIIDVEQDDESSEVPYISKGTDGRALR